jgi:hypothetical protein
MQQLQNVLAQQQVPSHSPPSNSNLTSLKCPLSNTYPHPSLVPMHVDFTQLRVNRVRVHRSKASALGGRCVLHQGQRTGRICEAAWGYPTCPWE